MHSGTVFWDETPSRIERVCGKEEIPSSPAHFNMQREGRRPQQW